MMKCMAAGCTLLPMETPFLARSWEESSTVEETLLLQMERSTLEPSRTENCMEMELSLTLMEVVTSKTGKRENALLRIVSMYADSKNNKKFFGVHSLPFLNKTNGFAFQLTVFLFLFFVDNSQAKTNFDKVGEKKKKGKWVVEAPLRPKVS